MDPELCIRINTGVMWGLIAMVLTLLALLIMTWPHEKKEDHKHMM